MAIFASTTTSGYSDPLKAYSIKALEARQKDMMAQQAAQQAQMFTPENTQTPIQGLAQVANVGVDAFRQNRAEQAAAEGRNEFASIIAQGPKGPDGAWAPEQLSVMARRAPEQMAEFYKNAHDLKYQGNSLRSAEKINTETQDATTGRNTADIEGRAKTTAATNASNEAQTLMTTNTNREIAALGEGGKNTRLASEQAQQARMAQINADIDDAKQQKQFFQQDKQTDKANEQQTRITKLQAELALLAQTQGEGAKAAMQKEELGQSAEMKKLDREAQAANLKLELANRTQNGQMKIEAEKDLARINASIDREKQVAAEAFKARMQADEIASKEKVEANKLTSAKEIAAAEAVEKAKALASDPKRNEAIRAAETDYRKALSHIDNLETAAGLLEHPKGIYTGAMQSAAPVMGGLPGVGGMLVDKEKAQRTSRYNTLVGEDAIRDMSTTLKGSSTNFELQKFEKMKNDPNISDAERATQLRKAIKYARADMIAQAKEVKAIGGDVGSVDRAMKEPVADVPRPAGKTDSELIAAAEAAKKAGKPAAAVDAQLQKWLMSK